MSLSRLKGIQLTITELREIAANHAKHDIVRKLDSINHDDYDLFVSDGCSSFPDALKNVSFFDLCFWHDASYFCGGTELERLKADFVLAYGIAEKFANDGKEYFGVKLADVMLSGVRFGGKDTGFNLPWEWGYGKLDNKK